MQFPENYLSGGTPLAIELASARAEARLMAFPAFLWASFDLMQVLLSLWMVTHGSMEWAE